MAQKHVSPQEPLMCLVQYDFGIAKPSECLLPDRPKAPTPNSKRPGVSTSFLSYSRIIRKGCTSLATSAKSLAADNGNGIPSFIPPSNEDINAPAVSEGMTLVLSVERPPVQVVCFAVSLHVYELSNGLFERRSKELTGVHVSGIYHSGVVCYGMEFFFEGGIAVAAAGHTRFGKGYEKVPLGTTSKSLSEFKAWISQREEESYQMSAYHPTQHNCHHFSSDAAAFLVGPAGIIPSHLTTTIDDLLKTRIGAAVEELMLRFIRGIQYGIAKVQWKRMIERGQSAMLITQSVQACGIGVQPPACIIFFRVDDAYKSRKALDALTPYVEQLVQRGVISPTFMEGLRPALLLGEGVESVDPDAVMGYVDMIACTLTHTHRTLWGPILNCLRIAILHKVALSACVFHPQLLPLLASGVRDFMSMTADGKLALLRVLCNLSSGTEGAVALNSPGLSDLWVSAVGLALLEYRNTAIVYTGAALSVNLVHAFVLTTQPTLAKSLCSSLFSHSANRLITVLLFFLCRWPPERLSEAAKNMLLLALFFIAFSSRQAMKIVKTHPFRVNFADLLSGVRTNESKALLCLLHSIECL